MTLMAAGVACLACLATGLVRHVSPAQVVARAQRVTDAAASGHARSSDGTMATPLVLWLMLLNRQHIRALARPLLRLGRPVAFGLTLGRTADPSGSRPGRPRPRIRTARP
jgi:hypothetical protein